MLDRRSVSTSWVRVDDQARAREGAHHDRRQPGEQGRRRDGRPAEQHPGCEHRARSTEAGHRGALGTVGAGGVDRPEGQHDHGQGGREHSLDGHPLGRRPERKREPGRDGEGRSAGQPQHRGARPFAGHGEDDDHGAREEQTRRPPSGPRVRRPSCRSTRWQRRGRGPPPRRRAAPSRPRGQAPPRGPGRARRDGIRPAPPGPRRAARLTVASGSRSSRRRVESSRRAGPSLSVTTARPPPAVARGGCCGGGARPGGRRGAVDADHAAVQARGSSCARP